LRKIGARSTVRALVAVLAVSLRAPAPPNEIARATNRVVVRELRETRADARPLLELVVDSTSRDAAALITVKKSGVSGPAWFDRLPGPTPSLRLVLDPEDLTEAGDRDPDDGAWVLRGERDAIERAVSGVRAGASEDRPGSIAGIDGQTFGVLVERLKLPTHSERLRPFTADVLPRARALVDSGEPAAAIDLLESVRAAAPFSEVAQIDSLAAEAALKSERVRLAEAVAERGLGADLARRAEQEASLLRTLILAKTEGTDSDAPPPARERLRASEAMRKEPSQRLLDAALDVQVAELLDRSFPRGRRMPEAVARFVDALAVADEESAQAVAETLCRAASFLARSSSARARDLLARGTRLAAATPRVTDQVECLLYAGSIASREHRLDEAERSFRLARDLLAGHHLPRQEREAYFGSATIAAKRHDYAQAFAMQRRACQAIDALLEAETDVDAREALLAGAVGYYSDAATFAIRAGLPAEAVAIAEAGKARGYTTLLRGLGSIEESELGEWLVTLGSSSTSEAAAIEARARALGPEDMALSYTFTGANEEGVASIAIGVLTREGVRAILVPYDAAFARAFGELPRAVRQNDTVGAARAGKVLYDTLFAPIEPWVAGKRRVFISPHLTLHRLPWAALHDGAGFLTERLSFARVPPLLAPGRTREDDRPSFGGPSAARWLVVLDPDHPQLPPLPGWDSMAGDLEAQLHPLSLLRGGEATPERFIDDLSRVDAVLFAGHADYDPKRPLRSSLLFSVSDSGRDRVDAAELLRMRHPLELVLLIGCETASQYAKRLGYSDETIGLPRAFLVVGARHVAGALWPVLDRDAEDFVRALVGLKTPVDTMRAVGEVQACMARGSCESRGVAAWGTFVLDTR
jgi:hypothetical protein